MGITPIQARDNLRQWILDNIVNNATPMVVQFDNQPITDANGQQIAQPTDSEWVRAAINISGSQQVETAAQGANTHRHLGTVIFQVFTPADKGDQKAWALAQIIADTFIGAVVGSVRFQTPSIRVAGRTNNWWQINVVCPFRFDEIG